MCILFVYRGDDDSESDYELIVATNRDEYYDRPALLASLWEEDPDVIGGRDMEAGREGGAWFAMSPARARLGVLLNISGCSRPDAKGRGNIVTDYVRSEVSTEHYVKRLESESQLYSGFNLVTIEIGMSTSKLYCYSNVDNKLTEIDGGSCHGFGNSLVDTPLKKVSAGTERFQRVCKEWARSATQETLIEELLQLLKWDESHLPDAELQRLSPRWCEQLSSVFVRMPAERYGSRTHTLVLVRKDGSAEFLELSLKQPVDTSAPAWHRSHLHCRVHP